MAKKRTSRTGLFGKPHRSYRPETQADMIDSTNRFLSWALGSKQPLPRIPRKRMNDGGFSAMLRNRGARALVTRFWNNVLRSRFFD